MLSRDIMTMTTCDPPVTVVCAYLPFCNPLIDDIAPRCSTFRAAFTTYIADLAANSPHRQRSLIIGGDLQVALTDLDESVSLMPPSPGSTEQERMDHATLVSSACLIDSYRFSGPVAPPIRANQRTHVEPAVEQWQAKGLIIYYPL